MSIEGLKYYSKDPKRLFGFLASRNLLNWMADEDFVKMKFKLLMGYELDLNNPKTFNEKLQWLKLYDRKDEYSIIVDKLEVKRFVADIIGREHIIPTIGFWDKAEGIDFDMLPQQFVLKCTHDSGGIVVCRDKDSLNIEKARDTLSKCLKTNYYWRNREWPYKNVKPRIIAEKFMSDDANGTDGLSDYKFYCFNGKPLYLALHKGMENHATATVSYITMDWEMAAFKRKDYKSFDALPPKPACFDEMVSIAEKLCKGYDFIRVDLYQINGKVYFSELTLTPSGGFTPFEPEEWNAKIGDMLMLTK